MEDSFDNKLNDFYRINDKIDFENLPYIKNCVLID